MINMAIAGQTGLLLMSLLLFIVSSYGYLTNKYRDRRPLILPMILAAAYIIVSVQAVYAYMTNTHGFIDGIAMLVLAIGTVYALIHCVWHFMLERSHNRESCSKACSVHSSDR